jgi:predicted transcriptional regulator YheO
MDLKDRWGAIVNCIADLLGPKAEVVLHDVSHPNHSIIMIRNGHVTGRTVGAPLTDLGFYMLRESDHRIETLGVYQSKTDDGKLLQCNAANLRGAHGRIEAILCINIDVTRETEKHSHNGTTAAPAEHYQTSVDQVVERMISDARREIAAPTIYKYIQLARRHRATTKKPAGLEQRPKRVRPRANA